MRANSYLEIFTFLGIISGIILGTLLQIMNIYKITLAFSILGFMFLYFFKTH